MKRKFLMLGALVAALAAVAVLWGQGAGANTAQANGAQFLNELENLRTNHNVPLILAYATAISDGKDDKCEEIGFSDEEANGVDPSKGNLSPLVNLPCRPEGWSDFGLGDPNDGTTPDYDSAVVIFVPAPSFIGTECWDYRAEDGDTDERTACIEVKDDNTPLIELWQDEEDSGETPFSGSWDVGVEVNSAGCGGMFISNASTDLTLSSTMQDVPGVGLTIKGCPDQIAEAFAETISDGSFDEGGGDDIKKMKVEVCLNFQEGGSGDEGQTAAFDLKVWFLRLNPALFGGNPNASGAGVFRLTDGTFQSVCQFWVLGLHGSALVAPLQVEARKSGGTGTSIVASTNGVSRIAVVDFIEEGDPELFPPSEFTVGGGD